MRDRCYQPSAKATQRHCARGFRAFTLVELLVILGILTILVALLLPSLGHAWDRARRTRDLAQLRSNTTLIGQYTNDYRSVYPIGYEHAFSAAKYWHSAMIRGGYLSSQADADPYGKKRYDHVRFWMSQCMTFTPRLMLPGSTIPVDDQMATAVRTDQVTYPSAKGLMVQMYADREPVTNAFCCVMDWKAPVGFADGSGEFGSYLDYSGGTPPVIVDTIGMPILSTWGGFLSRDR